MSAVIADPAAGAAPPSRLRGKKKLVLIGALALVLLLVLGGAAVAFLKHRAAQAAEAAADDDASADAAGPSARSDPKRLPFYLPLDPFVINLADREADRYAQIGITLELDNGAAADQIKAYMPAIRNSVLLILAGKTSRELLDRAGKEQLAQDIMREAVRPMGIEVAAPEPIGTLAAAAAASGAASASAAASGVASAEDIASRPKAKPRLRREGQRNPIQHVHFSSFIIQ
jgi:flagellar FliL protein